MNGIIFIYFVLGILSLIELFNADILLRKLFWLISCFLFIFVIGLGYKVGVDWVTYQDEYLGKIEGSTFELFYRFFTELSSKYISFWAFATLIKTIYCCLILRLNFLVSKLPITSLTIFFGMSYPFVNDPLRQLIAANFFLLICLLGRSYPKIYQIIFISGFHISSLTLLLGKLKIFSKRSNKILFISLVLGLFLAILLRNAQFINSLSLFLGNASDKLIFYSSQFQFANIFSSIVRVTIFGLGLYLANKNGNDDSELNNLIYKLSFLMFLLEIASLGLPILGQRIRLYLLPFVLIILVNGIKNIFPLYRILILLVIEFYVGLSLFYFLNGKMGEYYSLEMNLMIQYIKGFPVNNWESNAYLFWITN